MHLAIELQSVSNLSDVALKSILVLVKIICKITILIIRKIMEIQMIISWGQRVAKCQRQSLETNPGLLRTFALCSEN